MTTKAKNRARKCLSHKRGVTVLVSPSSTQSWTSVRDPTQAIVNRPTHFTLTVAPSPRPVAQSQNHQLTSKAFDGPCSCWFVKQVQASAVKAVNMINGESNSIRRDCVTKALSAKLVSLGCHIYTPLHFFSPKMTKPAPKAADIVRQPDAFSVRNIVGTVRIPKIAGRSLIATYGTPGSR